MTIFEQRHADKIIGTVGCFDRIVLMGTFPEICHAKALTSYFYAQHLRIFDLAVWAKPLAEELRARAEALAVEHGLTIEFIRKKNVRKEERVAAILKQRGSAPGLVHIFSALETCNTFRPWHDKGSGRTFFKPDCGKCLHYYFYFIDAELGLCYLRVPTWAPFRLQLYFNGHNLLASQLRRQGIAFTLQDNAFVEIADFSAARKLAATFMDLRTLHHKLDAFVADYCPALTVFRQGVHWSIMQLEFAVDVVFKTAETFAPLYENLTRTAIHAVKPEHVATFLGRTLDGRTTQDIGGDFKTQIQGTRIKHFMGPTSLKLYDKFGRIARVECTANDVSFFKHPRKVEHRDGTSAFQVAPVKKSIYSLHVLAALLHAACVRYLDFLAAIDDPAPGLKNVQKIAAPQREGERSYRGFNLLAGPDLHLFESLAQGEFCISGFRAKHLRRRLPHLSKSQLTTCLKRLRIHGLIKKVGRTFKYYLTKLGTTTVTAALKLRTLVLIPALQTPARL
jgi:hypothetical protein